MNSQSKSASTRSLFKQAVHKAVDFCEMVENSPTARWGLTRCLGRRLFKCPPHSAGRDGMSESIGCEAQRSSCGLIPWSSLASTEGSSKQLRRERSEGSECEARQLYRLDSKVTGVTACHLKKKCLTGNVYVCREAKENEERNWWVLGGGVFSQPSIFFENFLNGMHYWSIMMKCNCCLSFQNFH